MGRTDTVRFSVCVLLVFIGVLATVKPLRAQDSDTTSTDRIVAPKPATDFTVVADPVSFTEPYRHWTIHTGAATECVANLRVSTGSGGKYQIFSALVVRCDGFILVPRVAFDMLAAGATGDVVVRGAEAEAVIAPYPVAGWERFPSSNRRLDYAPIKVNGHHVRCLPLLAGSNAREGLSVRIIYSVPTVTATSSTCAAVTLHATLGITGDRGVHFTLQSIQDDHGAPAQAESIPLGAAVIDEETGAGLGVVTSTGAAPALSTFLRFGEEYNEIGLSPSRNALKLLRAATAGVSDGSSANSGAADALGKPGRILMVPGGPLTLQGSAREHCIKLYNTDIACTPAFQIEELPVTNGDFRQWLQATHGAWPMPIGWAGREVEEPVHPPDLPVTGVPVREASDYLNLREERLVTEVEWQCAAKVANLDWLERLQKQWEELASACSVWGTAFASYWVQLAAQERFQQAAHGGPPALPPNIDGGATPQDLLTLLWGDGNQIMSRIDKYRTHAYFARFIHPVRAYEDDISLHGVRDVVLNAPELTLPRGYRESDAYKPFADRVDPYVSYTKYSGSRLPESIQQTPDPGSENQVLYYYEIRAQNIPESILLPYFGIELSGGIGARAAGGGAGPSSGGGRRDAKQTLFAIHEMSLEWHGQTDPEFRGAR